MREFLRSWESAGRADYKVVIDSQLLHSVALTYQVSGARIFSTTLELQNLSDERVGDGAGQAASLASPRIANFATGRSGDVSVNSAA